MIDQLRSLFCSAIGEFLREETDNILNGTSERNLCGRLAPILERLAIANGFTTYQADVEYNRNQGGKIKTIMDGDMKVVPITCDIILHSRGAAPTKDNLIAIEMKRSGHPEAEKQKDRTRLRALTKSTYDNVWSSDGKTLPEHVCGYSLGYLIELDTAARGLRIEEYVDGQPNDRFDRRF
jgi:hypothetical protein